MYTGNDIVPDKSQIKVSVKTGNTKTELSTTDFEIVSCTNNRNAGTAKITIRGVGNYGGYKNLTFKIVKRQFVVQSLLRG